MPSEPPPPDEQRSVESAGASAQQKKEIEWNDALEMLLCNEAEKCAGLAWLHTRSEVIHSKRANFLQIPMIILSTVTGAVSVGSEQLFGNSQYSSVGIGAVGILVGILGTLNSYFAFSKRAEGHRLGATQYGLIHRAIMIEMALPRNQRTIPKVMLRMIKDELKRLQEVLPRVSEEAIAAYKREIIPNSVDVEHPDITSTIHAILPYNEAVVHAALEAKQHLHMPPGTVAATTAAATANGATATALPGSLGDEDVVVRKPTRFLESDGVEV